MYRYKKSIEVGGRGLSSCQGGGMGMGGAVWASSYAESSCRYSEESWWWECEREEVESGKEPKFTEQPQPHAGVKGSLTLNMEKTDFGHTQDDSSIEKIPLNLHLERDPNGAFIQQPNHLVDRTWGSSSDWVLELRDGKRLSIPLSLLQPPDPIGSSDANLHVQICRVGWGKLLEAVGGIRGLRGGGEMGGDRKKLMKSVGKGIKELKGLMSSINYESGSTKHQVSHAVILWHVGRVVSGELFIILRIVKGLFWH
uniref:Uncharacterized protein n=1 Tax=Fagus sylvatica TaxID=28930 RepID=A0A2N9FR24_FAGSY